MTQLQIPKAYDHPLDIRETEIAIKFIKDFFEHDLAKELNLTRVSAPLFVRRNTGLNDDLNGVERPVAFEVIHALRSENSGVFIEEIVLDVQMAERFFETSKLSMFHKRLIVLGIYKQSAKTFFFNPSNTLSVEEGDVAIVVGTRSLIDEFKALMRRKKRG